ncbi:hypothetical protein BDFG_02685 [Blastomyces dermatitidis ATCC 26199]|nr:hypothetical protein BDFG_02685 [Blastomyces dermatitidis ATCC 26199]
MKRELICSGQLLLQIHDIHIALITQILQVPGDSSLIDNEIVEMRRGARTIELSARICEDLLTRRLTAKRGTVLLEARSWPEKGRGLAAGLKIGCSDETEKDEDTVMSSSTPAPPAGKK